MVKLNTNSKELPAHGPLHSINKAFHEGYTKRKDNIRARVKAGDVLIFVKMGNDLVAICGDERQKYVVNGDKYHHLKAMAHMPVACYFALCEGLDTHVLEAVKSWSQQIQVKCSEDHHETSALMVTLKNLIQKFLDANQVGQSICHQSFIDFSTALEPVLAKLLSQSADDEVANLTQCLDDAHALFKRDSADIYLLVFGAHQPRYKEIAKLVFRRWFKDLHEHIIDVDHHVRYSESCENSEDAIDLVVTALADREIAQNFLGSASGLNQDVLGIVAEEAIERHWKTYRM